MATRLEKERITADILIAALGNAADILGIKEGEDAGKRAERIAEAFRIIYAGVRRPAPRE